jgi:acyl-ACP thioesterase
MGHVNNAAYWAAVEQRLQTLAPNLREPHRARLDYRHPIDLDERVELAEDVRDGRYGAAFVVGDTVKAVVWVESI